MVRYFLRIGYIGTKYRGTQKQLGNQYETVQGVIENALMVLKPQNEITTSFASRTDKGVHALMNAFHVDLDHKISGGIYKPHFMTKMLNSYLVENNHEIVVTDASVVPEHFNVRFHAKWRSYIFRLAVLKPSGIKNIHLKDCQGYLPICEINRSYAVPSELNTDLVKNVADMYCGEHDFCTFTKYTEREPWKSTVRVIDECRLYESSHPHFIDDTRYSNVSIWEFYIKSRGFLYHQVRKMVGTAVSVGLGRLTLSDVQNMFDNPRPDGWIKSAFPPPCALYLAHIHYDKEDFVMNYEETTKISNSNSEISEENSCTKNEQNL
ncbi:tRNA pseudouridine synthase A [Caerostris darwini]|uniref:tRNA pseudouridine synthase n=1 Tax=Caerostris darwini TaxID=1538125 RepID=A0AAV4NYX0_9ARAC|nr:tRNA pseudouridine synthase A [Caerostris darwini]